MFKNTFIPVIQVDSHTDTIHFYTKSGSKFRHDRFSCSCACFDQDFFDRFGKSIQFFRQSSGAPELQKCVLILPDHLFLTDTVKVPMIHRQAMKQSLQLAIAAVYKNAAELNIKTIAMQQNKQFATYGLVGIRQDVLSKFRQTCAQQNVLVSGVSFAANATVNGALAANPKLKNGTFLLLDIQKNASQFAFVGKGNTLGYYDLPFGYAQLLDCRLVSEDLLFDHGPAELLVRTAAERARAKQREDLPVEAGTELVYADSAGKKTARHLPKFMQRPTPQSGEEYTYENFRIFMKWALDLVRNNPDIYCPGEELRVYVNLPAQYRYLFAMANSQHNGQQVIFSPLLTENTPGYIGEELALYGGFYCHSFNKQNTF